MNRLDFVIDDFTRIQWAPEAQQLWVPRIHKITQALRKIELESVLRGLRKSALLMVSPEELPNLARKVAEHEDYVFYPLGLEGVTQTYSATSVGYSSGRPFQYRVAVTHREFAYLWNRWNDTGEGRDVLFGELLGYPKCCLEFFKKFWVDEQMVDLTWPAALNSQMTSEGNVLEVRPSLFSNIILRWLGVRFVFHMPHSFNCGPSDQIGEIHDGLGRLLGFNQEMDWLRDMLQWPVEWNALHGVAIITTPVCKIVTRTDATADKYTVRVLGFHRAEHAASGVSFPLEVHRGMEVWRKTLWEDNGFRSLEGMVAAHMPILDVLHNLIPGDKGDVVDFGCGNCELLRKILEQFPWIPKAWGVDTRTDVLARRVLAGIEVAPQNIFDFNTPVWKESHDIGLMSLVRLTEASEVSRDLFLKMVSKRFRYFVFYTYSDSPWPDQFDGFGLGEVLGTSVTENCQAVLVKIDAGSSELQGHGKNQDTESGNLVDSNGIGSAERDPSGSA